MDLGYFRRSYSVGIGILVESSRLVIGRNLAVVVVAAADLGPGG